MLTAEQKQAAKAGKRVEVPVPEWPEWGQVFVRTLKGSDRAELIGLSDTDLFNHLIVHTTVNESGESLGLTAEDIPELDLPPLVRIFKASIKLNGIGSAAIEEAKGN